MSRSIIIYGDGSCLGNPGPGGWAIHVIDGSEHHDFCGGEAHSTNNRMELVAMCRALEWSRTNLGRDDAVEIFLDNRNALQSTFEWLEGWKRKGWKKADGKPIANLDIIQDIDANLLALRQSGIRLKGTWVKGHSNIAGNEHADGLAHGEASAWKAGNGSTFRKVDNGVDQAPEGRF